MQHFGVRLVKNFKTLLQALYLKTYEKHSKIYSLIKFMVIASHFVIIATLFNTFHSL